MENKIVAYYRLSKMDKTSTGLGLEAQEQIVRHYYKDSIVKEFTEIKSAKNITDRPVLQEAIAYCQEHKCTLVVAKLDRLSRNVDDCRHVLNVLGSSLRSCDIPGQLDKFSLTLFAAFAERERELIALRTSQALQARKRRGLPIGNPKNFTAAGRAKGRDRVVAIASEANLKAADLICDLRQRGMTYQAIADRLNKRQDTTSQGKPFTDCSVFRIFKRSESLHRV